MTHITVDDYVDTVMASRPPLTDAQRERLRALLITARQTPCAVKACPSLTTPCAFHARSWPARGTDRAMRQRPGDSERGGGFTSPALAEAS